MFVVVRKMALAAPDLALARVFVLWAAQNSSDSPPALASQKPIKLGERKQQHPKATIWPDVAALD
jgi:hypothetical protein